jgi:hypothetical protein
VLEKVPVGIPGPAYDITTAEGWVWARFSDLLVAKIDPEATRVVEQFRDGQGGGGLRVAYGAIWASAFQQDRVWRISLE